MASIVLGRVESGSEPGKFYQIMRDDTNSGRLWCKVENSEKACTAWTVGWKRRYGYHTCKHITEWALREGAQTEVRDDFLYLTGNRQVAAGRPVERSTAALNRLVARNTESLTRARAGSPPARIARPAAAYVPSLEQVRQAVRAPSGPSGLVQRGSRRRPDDE
jgi:hypothetical protein